MNKYISSFVNILIFSSIVQAGILTPDKKVGNVKLSIGQATFENESSHLYTLEFGGNYYYNNEIMWGAQFGLGYTENPDKTISNKTMGELNGQFRIGYSFGELAKGFGLYGLCDMSYLLYNSRNQDTLEQENNFASGIGFGGGVEYVFDSSWIITATYSKIDMTPDKGNSFDYSKALFGVGYTW
ncbi:outer membrane beta-barrel protein [Sulfurimonas sp.]|uniref:outer membrane beta-barrel protein n=1 Tax=Sulfurimonas sp. TaxID=2022749 RepID=UPI003D124D03